MAKVTVQYTEKELKDLVKADLDRKFPNNKIEMTEVHFEVKASMNYRSEWERGEFRMTVESLLFNFLP